MQEIWKDIAGYEGLYQVSNLGRVKSLERVVKNGCHTSRIVKERIMAMKLNGSGYVDVVLSNNGKTERLHIHRLVANAFIDNPDNKKQVNHIDYNRTNNAVSNLEWCSAKENMAHSAHRMKKPKKIRTHIPLSGHRYISKIGNRYRVQIQTLNVCERFSTIEEALAYRDKVISENDWR